MISMQASLNGEARLLPLLRLHSLASSVALAHLSRTHPPSPYSLPPPPTSACSWSLQVVASAIVDKYIGESARLIREMFG